MSEETYQSARSRLEEILEEVNREEVSLDDALVLYEEAVRLSLAACDLSESDLGLAADEPAEPEEPEEPEEPAWSEEAPAGADAFTGAPASGLAGADAPDAGAPFSSDGSAPGGSF